MTTTDREKQLRNMAELEAKYQLEDYDFMGIFEVTADYGFDLTDEEADYVHYLIVNARAELPFTTFEEHSA